ncbi:hypothetical protein CTI12_AA157530 [Artemisia annua]|uniref:Uncharacterized protein n=1 Tax=Artemisia annua TaxID=35608 RepID=A0A2U1LZX9_ARTAN|nr:hypothetical protein CTI12_AA157530 [Artemisia annua]
MSISFYSSTQSRMPCGPKKRRAARKKNDGDASFKHPAAEEKVDATAELSEIVSKVSEVSIVDVHAEAKPEIGLKENEGKKSECADEQTVFEDSVIEQTLVNQNLTKCSQMSFGGDFEGVTLEPMVQPLADPVIHSYAADSSLESVQKEANGAFDKPLESSFNEPPPPIDIAGDEKDQVKQEMTLLEQLLLQSTEGLMLAQKQMEVYKIVCQILHKLVDEIKSQKRT